MLKQRRRLERGMSHLTGGQSGHMPSAAGSVRRDSQPLHRPLMTRSGLPAFQHQSEVNSHSLTGPIQRSVAQFAARSSSSPGKHAMMFAVPGSSNHFDPANAWRTIPPILQFSSSGFSFRNRSILACTCLSNRQLSITGGTQPCLQRNWKS